MKQLVAILVIALMSLGCQTRSSRRISDEGAVDIARLIIEAGSGDERAARALERLHRQEPALFSGKEVLQSVRGEGLAMVEEGTVYRFMLVAREAKWFTDALWWERYKGRHVSEVPQVTSSWDGVRVDLSTMTLIYELLVDVIEGCDVDFTVRDGIIQDIVFQYCTTPRLPSPERHEAEL